jgi:phenylalanyl-tRNA synthetase beta chain
MKFSEQWLREWVNPPITLQELISQLTMMGNEVEAHGPVAGEFNNVIVAEVIAAEPHPNAERLQLCQVYTGSETVQVVCGGKNVRAGLKVPFAKLGARLPNNIVIKKAKIRGAESQGMICSSSELGLQESAPHSIMELPLDAPIGCDFREYLQLNDHFIELSLTPNRGDCLSIQGVARELSAINSMLLNNGKEKTIPATITEVLPIKLQANAACPHYVGRVIKNINAQAETPLWMKERLRRSDIRSISLIVDITNYVMLELGQPLHAFDLEKLTGGIVVRFAKGGEKIALLDETEKTLTSDTLIIADEKNSLAIAGIMGGVDSSVTESTRHIFLESAFFSPEVIAGKGMKYNTRTDSAHRFERGVDPKLQVKAIERATELLLTLGGGEAGPIQEQTLSEALPQIKPIYLRFHKIANYLGIELDKETIADLLVRLHFTVETYQEGWQVSVPSFRFDVKEEVDLIEEIARLYGYDKIPVRAPFTWVSSHLPKENVITTDTIINRLQHLGYHQAITYSFVDPKLQQTLYPEINFLTLANPIASDMAAMRLGLLPGLITAVTYNQNRQHTRLRLFEIGQRFVPENNHLKQDHIIAGIVTGPVNPEQWGMPQREVDFFDVKGDVENLLALNGQGQIEFVKMEHPSLHPGQCAGIKVNGQTIGYVGVLAPAICQTLNINHPVVFEIELNRLKEKSPPSYKAISKFPFVRRDLALVIDETVTAAELEATIRQIGDSLLQEILIFDVYMGKNIQIGKKSIAIGLILQDSTRTLIDEEVNHLIDKIVLKLKETYQANLR